MNLEKQRLWVDSFTSDLFFNANHDNYDALDNDATDQELFEALVQDAEEFIEVIAQSFSGISIDHEPRSLRSKLLRKSLGLIS